MARLLVEIKLNPVFIAEKTFLQNCCGCGEIIYSDNYRLWIMPKKIESSSSSLNLRGHKTNFELCESCYSVSKLQ